MRYLRNRPTREDDRRAALVSTAVAAGVGLVVFYFVRLLLAREPLETGPEADPDAAPLELPPATR